MSARSLQKSMKFKFIRRIELQFELPDESLFIVFHWSAFKVCKSEETKTKRPDCVGYSLLIAKSISMETTDSGRPKSLSLIASRIRHLIDNYFQGLQTITRSVKWMLYFCWKSSISFRCHSFYFKEKMATSCGRSSKKFPVAFKTSTCFWISVSPLSFCCSFYSTLWHFFPFALSFAQLFLLFAYDLVLFFCSGTFHLILCASITKYSTETI